MAFTPSRIIPASGYIDTREDKSICITEGPLVHEFEQKMAGYVGTRFAAMCNSGSSALFLAVAALELPPGSEVITTALAFPTTVSALLWNGLVPVFVDVDDTFNINPDELIKALTNKTRAVLAAHTLGNPFNVEAVTAFCEAHELFLIEDCCDALGAQYNRRKVGTFGHLATLSFYPAHQITTGEGGMVLTNSAKLNKVVRSFRDWGRDCWCAPGQDNTCGKRFAGEYDHKYTYSRWGMNLKSTDYQAAIGLTQFPHIGKFVNARGAAHILMYLLICRDKLAQRRQDKSFPSWFGFAMKADDIRGFENHLAEHKIGTRRVFAGNILRQPGYKGINCQVIGDLPMTNFIHDHVLWVGCWPGITAEELDYMIEVINAY